jgi:hypothetical protein
MGAMMLCTAQKRPRKQDIPMLLEHHNITINAIN